MQAKSTLLLVMLLIMGSELRAQRILEWLTPKYDTSYIKDHSDNFTGRVYGTTNFNQLKFGGDGHGTVLKYKTNDNFNIGLGVGYRFLGFSASFKTPLVNNDESTFGKTTGVNLSTTVFYRRLTLDIFANFNRGFYLSNSDVYSGTKVGSDDLYERRDLKTRNIGVGGQYIFNNKKFSFRSAFLQSEYQRKSAGSFIIGAMAYYNRIKADSAIIPKQIDYPDFAAANDFNKVGAFVAAINAGYAYAFVYRKHYFVTAGAALGVGLNYTTLSDGATHSSVGTQTHGIFRIASGYNSEVYYAGFTYQRQFARNSLPDVSAWEAQQFGGFQIILAKRFKVGKKMAKKFDDVTDDAKKKMGLDGVEVTPK